MVSDLWEQLYEPKSLDEIIGQTELVNAFKAYVKAKFVPEMTIAGVKGVGKTLLMKCYAHDMGWCDFDEDGRQIDLIPGQFFIMNASMDNRIDTVRNSLKRLAEKPTRDDIDHMPRLIVLDEFDYTPEAQGAMRSLMQNCTSNTRFIILSNDPSNIIDPIISRCPMKVAKPLTLDDMKIVVARLQKHKDFKVANDAVELLYKKTQGDIRGFIKQLQDACILSNYDVQAYHIQKNPVDVEVAKGILDAAVQNNYEQAREVMLTVYMKTMEADPLLKSLYDAVSLVRFSDVMPDNAIIQARIRDRIAEIDYRRTQGTNGLIQLDSIINYIKLIKFVPLQCPKAK